MNKVETMVEGRWPVAGSALVTEEQKQVLLEKLAHRITADGQLLVKSQVERSQLGNKAIVIKKMLQLVNQALEKKKARIATQPTAASKIKRIENKKKESTRKENRRKLRPGEY